jgi:hypothetical protein
MFSAGTRASSKKISAVLEARCPILSSTLPMETPRVALGTTKALSPRGPFSGAALAKTTKRSATPALVMKHLDPLMTYSEPSFLAVVLIAVVSEPDSRSVRQ